MATSSSRLSTAILDGLEAAFGFPSIPGYDPLELKKFCDVIASTVLGEFTTHAELDGAALDSDEVTGTTDATSLDTAEPLASGEVTDPNVSGGIK